MIDGCIVGEGTSAVGSTYMLEIICETGGGQ